MNKHASEMLVELFHDIRFYFLIDAGSHRIVFYSKAGNKPYPVEFKIEGLITRLDMHETRIMPNTEIHEMPPSAKLNLAMRQFKDDTDDNGS